jgi:hypothetical protein
MRALKLSKLFFTFFQWEGKRGDLLRKTRENDGDLDGGKIGKRGIAEGNAKLNPLSMTKAQWERAKVEYLS